MYFGTKFTTGEKDTKKRKSFFSWRGTKKVALNQMSIYKIIAMEDNKQFFH